MSSDKDTYLAITGLAPAQQQQQQQPQAAPPAPASKPALATTLDAIAKALESQNSSTANQDPNKALRLAALERAHDIRKFEIDLYWKRANYFWLLQAAVFTAVGLTWKADIGTAGSGTGPAIAPIVPIALAGLGVVSSCAGWRGSLASKFWQRNWEHHVDMLEGEFEGHLYKTVYVGRDGTAGSVSGINENLAFCFFIFWALLLLVASFSLNRWDLDPAHLRFDSDLLTWETFGVWFVTAIGVGTMIDKGSKVTGKREAYPQNDLEIDSPEKAMGLKGKPHLIRREPSIK